MKPRAWDLEWTYGDKAVSWQTDAGRIAKAYNEPIQSACLLRQGDGIALVEPHPEVGCRNAVILNADGSERVRLSLPVEDALVYAFDSMYYIREQLTAIVATTRGDVAVIVDPDTGDLSGMRPSR